MRWAERDPAAVERIARALDCTITDRRQQADGSTALELSCPSIATKVDLLVALGRHDGEWFPDLIRQARSIVGAQAQYERAEGAEVDDEARVRLLQRFVQRAVGFAYEPIEVYPSALQVLIDGVGDCDDHALLLIALAHALDYDTDAGAIPERDPTHIAPIVFVDGSWLWCETTIDAELGEHPAAAARRLGLDRGDIA